MRLIVLLLVSFSFLSSKAQTFLPGSMMSYAQWQPFHSYTPIGDSSNPNAKWYFSKYGGVSAGFGYFNGVSATYLAAPFGIQINRQLNNNLVAFAGASVAPTFFNYTSPYSSPGLYKSYPGYGFSNAYGFGMSSRVELGLMYVNDAKTFSISGSIGVERSSYPIYPSEHPATRPSPLRKNP